MKKEPTYYQQEPLGKLIYPLKTFDIPGKELVVVYQSFALNLSPQKFHYEYLIFCKKTGELKHKFSNHRYSLNDILLIDQNQLLFACGDYDGGMNYNGELLLVNLSENTIEVLYKGRHFEKCDYNQSGEIEVTVFPYEDDSFSPSEMYVDTTYKLDDLNYILTLEDLKVSRKEKHKESFKRFDIWLEEAICQIEEILPKNITFLRAGSVRHLEIVRYFGKNIIISTSDNIGINLIADKKRQISFPIREGWFRQLCCVDNEIYVTFGERSIYPDCTSQIICYNLESNNVKRVYSGNFGSFSINKNKTLLVFNNEIKSKRKFDYAIINDDNITTGDFAEKNKNHYSVQTNNLNSLYFIQTNYDHPNSNLKLKRFGEHNSETIFSTTKFIGAYSTQSYFLIDDKYFIFHGRLSPQESSDNKLYGLIASNINTNEELLLIKNKENYFQISVDYESLTIYCLTSVGEIEVYDLKTRQLINIIDLLNYTDEIVISIYVKLRKLILGTIYGSIIEIDVREITIDKK